MTNQFIARLKKINWLRFTVISLLSIILLMVTMIWVYPIYRDHQLIGKFDSQNENTRIDAMLEMYALAEKYPATKNRLRELMNSDSDYKFEIAIDLLRALGDCDLSTLDPLKCDRYYYLSMKSIESQDNSRFEQIRKRAKQQNKPFPIPQSMLDQRARERINIYYYVLLNQRDNKYVRMICKMLATSQLRLQRATAATLAARLGDKKTLLKLFRDKDLLVVKSAALSTSLTPLAKDPEVIKLCAKLFESNSPVHKKLYADFDTVSQKHNKLVLKVFALRNELAGKAASLEKVSDKKTQLLKTLSDQARKSQKSFNIKQGQINQVRFLLASLFRCMVKTADADFIKKSAAVSDPALLEMFTIAAINHNPENEKHFKNPLAKIALISKLKSIKPNWADQQIDLIKKSSEDFTAISEAGFECRQRILTLLKLAALSEKNHCDMIEKIIRKNWTIGYPEIFSQAVESYKIQLSKLDKNDPQFKRGTITLQQCSNYSALLAGNIHRFSTIPSTKAAVAYWELLPIVSKPYFDFKNLNKFKPNPANSVGNLENTLAEPSGLSASVAAWMLSKSKNPKVDQLAKNLAPAFNSKSKNYNRNSVYAGRMTLALRARAGKTKLENIEELRERFRFNKSFISRSDLACILFVAGDDTTKNIEELFYFKKEFCFRKPVTALLASGDDYIFRKLFWRRKTSLKNIARLINILGLREVFSDTTTNLHVPLATTHNATLMWELDRMRREFVINRKNIKLGIRK